MNDEPKKTVTPTRKEVDFVALTEGTTRARAAYLLRSGYELEPGWATRLDQLYRDEVKNDDATAREAEARQKAEKPGTS